MNLNVIGQASVDKSVIEKMRILPAFRKATPAMMLTHAAIQAVLEANPEIREKLKAEPNRFGLVLSSAFGELETTIDFLKTLADAGIARPLLFQNSLHNSTSGFASIHFHITGPVVTVSHGIFPFEHALEVSSLTLGLAPGLAPGLATDLASGQSQCEYIFLVYVETFLADLVDPAAGLTAKDQAVALLLSSHVDGAKASIHDVECIRQKGDAAYSATYPAMYTGGPPAAEQFLAELNHAPADMHIRQVMRTQKNGNHASQITWVKR